MVKKICTENLSVKLIETTLQQQLINDEENTTKIHVTNLEEIIYYIKTTLKEIRKYSGEITFISQVSDVEMFVPKSIKWWYENLDEFIDYHINKYYKNETKWNDDTGDIENWQKEREILYTAYIYKALAQSDWTLGKKTWEKEKMNFAKIISQIITSKEVDINRNFDEKEISEICNLIISKSKHYEYDVNSSLSEILDKHVSAQEQNNIMNDIILFINTIK